MLDCLSCNKAPEDPTSIQNDEEFLDNRIFAININNEEWQQCLMTAQASNTAIRFAIKQLNDTGVIREGRFKWLNNVHWSDDILLRGDQVIILLSLRYEIVKDFHISLNHPGLARTLAAVAQHYVWSGMQLYIADYCAIVLTVVLTLL